MRRLPWRALLRTKVGRFTLDDAITLAQTEEAVKNGKIESKVLGIEEILAEYPQCMLHKRRRQASGKWKSSCTGAG